MTQPLDLTGRRFGRLLVIRRAENDFKGRSKWVCRCDCGAMTIVRTSSLSGENTKSCGCLWRETMLRSNTKHGYSKRNSFNHIRNIFMGMIGRCENPSNSQFKNYGARGITVCPEWHDLKTFGDWAKSHGCTDKMQIDRIDNDKGYNPSNCRFVTPKENSNNKRNTIHITIDGAALTISEAAEKYQCPRWRIVNRMKAGRKGLELISESIERKEDNNDDNQN